MLSYDPPEAHAKWAAGELRIVDCREPAELAANWIDGAEHIPMSRFAEQLDHLPDDLPLAILCRSGARSARVAYALEQTGRYGEVANIEGGIIAWADEGLPYEGDAPT